MLMFCSGKKCSLKKICERFVSPSKIDGKTTNFYTFCNKSNEYKWIMVIPNSSKKWNKIYNKRKLVKLTKIL